MTEFEVELVNRNKRIVRIDANGAGMGNLYRTLDYVLFDPQDSDYFIRLPGDALGLLDVTLNHCTPTLSVQANLGRDAVLVRICGTDAQENWPGAALAPGVFICTEDNVQMHFYLEDLHGALIVASALTKRFSEERP